MTAQFATATDTVQVSDTRLIARTEGKADTIAISDSVTLHRIALHSARANTVQISNTRTVQFASAPNLQNSDDIASSVGVVGIFVQYDTWRPVPKPTDNSLMLVCRTPENLHDSPLGLERNSLWTLEPDGSHEHPVLGDPTLNGYGWLRQSHPEWSPNGNWIVLAVETAGEYKLVLLNSSAYGLD